MLMLAFVYQGLAVRKPALNSGPYAYARAGFGPYIGFQSAWGYWVSAWVGNVSYAVAIFGSLAFFMPVFGKGNNLQSVIGASVGAVAAAYLGVARGKAGRLHQCGHDGRQDRPSGGVRDHRDHRLQLRQIHPELLGRAPARPVSAPSPTRSDRR